MNKTWGLRQWMGTGRRRRAGSKKRVTDGGCKVGKVGSTSVKKGGKSINARWGGSGQV